MALARFGLVALASVACAHAGSTQQDDFITSLPGADGLDLPNMYSGYLDLAGSDKHVFYLFVEASGAPLDKPVALWTNGGPGCSGFIGLMTEQGPFRPSADGTLEVNPASWHGAANVLFVEQPVGVGFSYSDDAKDYTTDDATAAADLVATARAFFLKFSQYQGSDFYLTSESYGGHYLPTTASLLLSPGGAAAELNFKGFFLGNPWTDPDSNAVGRVQTLYGHGYVPKPDYDAWSAACLGLKPAPAACAAASHKVLDESAWPGQNGYALSYPACQDGPGGAQEAAAAVSPGGKARAMFNQEVVAAGAVAQRLWLLERGMGKHAAAASPAGGQAAREGAADLVYDPCVDNYGVAYLNRGDVRAALHVNASTAPKVWTECSFTLKYNSQDGMKPMMPLYLEMMGQAAYPVKLEVYSGSDDSNCPLLGTMQWAYGLQLPESSAWAPWFYEDALYGAQCAGFQVAWSGVNGSSLTLSTVNGAGHEVPTYKGQQALQLFQAFLDR